MKVSEDRVVVSIARYSEPSRWRRYNAFNIALLVVSVIALLYPFWLYEQRGTVKVSDLLVGLGGCGGLAVGYFFKAMLHLSRVANALLVWQNLTQSSHGEERSSGARNAQ